MATVLTESKTTSTINKNYTVKLNKLATLKLVFLTKFSISLLNLHQTFELWIAPNLPLANLKWSCNLN